MHEMHEPKLSYLNHNSPALTNFSCDMKEIFHAIRGKNFMRYEPNFSYDINHIFSWI